MSQRHLLRGLLMVGALGCAMFVAGRGVAGWAPTQQVVITDQPVIGGHAEGKAGDVHNTEDATQFIGCGLRANLGSQLQANCWATDASGRQRACSSTDAGMIAVAASVGPDSYLYFAWNPGGKCTALESQNGSFMHPKK
jgi:hypothetical protein